MIPYSRQSIDESDIAAVAEAMRSEFLTTGPAVEVFEEALAARVGARHAVAVSSGTAALHLALLAAEIGPGHVVATTTISFSASANCARYVGANIDLVDIDPATNNLDVNEVPPCDALVAVDFAGLPIDLDALPHRPRVIVEDAAQALGAARPSGPVGNCNGADMTTFSFHPVKSITTGEGGAITTNDDVLAARLRRLRSHGMEPTPRRGSWSYDISELGYNFRLPDINAALGTSQLRRLDGFIAERNAIAQRYRDQLGEVSTVTLPPSPRTGVQHAYHLFVVGVSNRRHVYETLRAAGVGVQVHHVPIHQLAVHKQRSTGGKTFPVADRYYERCLSLPLYPGLTTAQQDRVVNELCDAILR